MPVSVPHPSRTPTIANLKNSEMPELFGALPKPKTTKKEIISQARAKNYNTMHYKVKADIRDVLN